MWKPIETAPMDGRELLTFDSYGCIDISWSEGGPWFAVAGGSIQPTHWMPLPSPPKAVTPESIAAAKRAQADGRAEVYRQTGIRIDDEGRVLPASRDNAS